MERRERFAQRTYEKLKPLNLDPYLEEIIKDEENHEEELLSIIDQEGLKYTGSIVLGLNDALVELTGVLSGLTFALRDTRLVSIAALVTGVAASFSMAGSEYLSTREEGGKNPLASAFYTGLAYILAVTILISPYLLIFDSLVALGVSLLFVVLIILAFNFYIAVAKNLPFGKRFGEMLAICLGVAFLNFCVGILLRKYLHI